MQGATAAVEQIEILKYENAKLRKYDGRLKFKPGGQSQLTKARVVDDAELLSLVAKTESRVNTRQRRQANKLCSEQLAREQAIKIKSQVSGKANAVEN